MWRKKEPWTWGRNWVTGSKSPHRQVHNPDTSPPSRRCVLALWKQHEEGRVGTWEVALEEDGHPGGGRQTETRGVTNEGGARRDPEQEEHSRTQATAMMMAHSEADGERSHEGGMAADSRGPTNGGRAGGGGARGRDGEPTSQADAKDPGGQGGADEKEPTGASGMQWCNSSRRRNSLIVFNSPNT